VHLYYGAADSVVCVAEASLAAMLSHLEQHSGELNTLGKPPSGIPGVA
jgi:hypothetical protein